MPVYNNFKEQLMNGGFNLGADTIKCALLNNTYVFNSDTHVFWSDISAAEASGTGYTAGGQALVNKIVSQDNVDDEGVFDADDVVWANSTITARYAAIYKDTGTATTSSLIAVFDFGSDKSSSGGDFRIQWNTEGLLNIN